MSEAKPSQEAWIRAWLDYADDEKYTSFPAKVLEFTSNTGNSKPPVVKVQPQNLEPYRNVETGERKTTCIDEIYNVPVMYPYGGGYSIYFPMAAGDFVLIVCTKYSLDRWRETASVTDPGDARRFGVDGAVAFPGLYPNKNSPGDNSEEGSMTINIATKLHLGGATTDPAVLGEELRDWLSGTCTVDSPFGPLTLTAAPLLTPFDAVLSTKVDVE